MILTLKAVKKLRLCRRDNDEKMAEIAENGATFITKHLKFKECQDWRNIVIQIV